MLVRSIPRSGFDRLGEGPVWVAGHAALFWTDILGHRLMRLTPQDGAVTCWTMPEPLCWLVPRSDSEGFLAGFASGLAWLSVDPLRIVRAGASFVDHPSHRLNDAKALPDGTVLAGTKSEHGSPTALLYRIGIDLTVDRVDDGYRVANGPAISADGRTVYHADSAARRIYRYRVGSDGSITQREEFVTFALDWGEPDGMTMDADGMLWVAHWGGARISRFRPDGVLDRAITLPVSQVTSCAFGGANLDRLYVTSAAEGVSEALGGAIFEIRPGVHGVEPSTFGGAPDDPRAAPPAS